MKAFFGIFVIIFFNCCCYTPTKYTGSVDANIDEMYFVVNDKECVGMCATDWAEKISVKTPPKVKNIYFRVRADDYVSPDIIPTYPFTEISLPGNNAKIVSISLVAESVKLMGTLYRENEEMSLNFVMYCGEKIEVNGVETCQLPVNSSLDIDVDLKEVGNVAVVSSLCDFEDVRKGVSGIQKFTVKGDFCPITVGTKDSTGKKYGVVLLRTATKSYIPIKNPTIDKNLCAPNDVDLMEVEYKNVFQSVGRESCIKGKDYDLIYLWDNQNARFKVIF